MKLYIWKRSKEELEIIGMETDEGRSYNPKENAKSLMELLYSYLPGNTLEALSEEFLIAVQDEWVHFGFTQESDELGF